MCVCPPFGIDDILPRRTPEERTGTHAHTGRHEQQSTEQTVARKKKERVSLANKANT